MRTPRSTLLLLLCLTMSFISPLGSWAAPQPGAPSPAPQAQISTLISPAHTPDPAVIFYQGYYYAIRSKIEVSEDNIDPKNWPISCWAAAQDQVIITKSRKLEDVFTNPEEKSIIINRKSPFGGTFGGISVGAFTIFSPPGYRCPSPGFWAPSLKNINNRWYIFLTGHRPDVNGEANFILESSSDDPMNVSGWEYRGMVDHEMPGLDGEIIVLPTKDALTETVTLRENGKTITGQLYYVYSHNVARENGDQQLWLARLQPDNSTFSEFDDDLQEEITYTRRWKVAGEGVISVPMYDWERQMCTGCKFGVNEGPTALYGPNEKTFIFYSASFCATKYYSLGMLEFAGVGSGFPFSWVKHPRPVFSGDVFSDQPQTQGGSRGENFEEKAGGLENEDIGNLNGTRADVFGIGHNSFTTSPDYSEYWMVYHAKTNQNEGPEDREARVQQFHWSDDGLPNFSPGPLPSGTMVRAPSDAQIYAIFCSENEFKGSMCTGLPEGKYENANLIARGIFLKEIKSIKMAGGASVQAYGGGIESEGSVVWKASKDVDVIEEGAFNGVSAVEVLGPEPPSVASV
jgi:GH43 family beta-xylosidase